MKSPIKTIIDNNQKNDEWGLLEENIDLPNQGSKSKQSESDMMLPHERDETTGPTGTNAKGDEPSREIIKKAHDDIEQGLKDTDRRGIPSDIKSSDSPHQAITEDIRKNNDD